MLAAEAVDEAPTLEGLSALVGDAPRELRALHRWLSGLGETHDLETATAALAGGVRWLRDGPGPSAKALALEPPPVARLRLLVTALERAPAFRRRFGAALTTLLENADFEPLFEIGLPNDRGILEETSDRLARRFLPSTGDERDGAELIGRIVRNRRDAAMLSALPAELLRALTDCLGRAAPWARAQAALRDAIALVATRTSALGLSREIRARSPEVALAASPYFLLPRLCDALFAGIGSTAACEEQIAACRATLVSVHEHLEQFGVSIDVVYRMEVIEKSLERLHDLILLVHGDDAAETAVSLVGKLARERQRDHSLRDLLRTNVHLLARKIIERAGETGEHYITATRAEYWKMIASAAGGGFLTAGTTVLKYLVAWGQFPLFVEGVFASTNYALSFVAMQLLGMTLATKQPSMTAAALAGALHGSLGREGEPEPELDELAGLIARICRSQLAAAIGNLGMVIPTAIGFHFLYARLAGHPFFDEKAAEHTLHSLNPAHSGTVFFAALTGVLLWLSSVGAGWFENWAVYRHLADALARHRLRRLVGRARMERFARWFRHHVAGFGGNVSLGALLGMTPVVGKFFGLPLEVRHVTLSTGSLALAVCAMGPRVAWSQGLFGAAVGIAVIGTLNFGVSFALALGVAVRARGVEHAGRRLLRAVMARLLRSPGEFFFPSA
jgi:site-specific recombinase